MKKRCTIGVIIGNANSPHAMNIMRGMDKAAKELDVNLLSFVSVRSSYVTQAYYVEEAPNTNYQYNVIYEYADFAKADALIMTYGMMCIFLEEGNRSNFLERFQGTPCVLLEEQLERPGWSSIIADNYRGMYEVVEHLTRDHGYRRIAYLSGPEFNTDAQQRKRAFFDVMEKYGLEADDRHVEYGDFSECVQVQVNALLDRFPDLEALVCANDLMAETACEECERRNLKIGKDIAVTGYDDWERVRYLPVPLTTVLQDSTDMGYLAVYSALDLIHGKPGKKQMIPVELRLRESCGCSCKQSAGMDQLEKITGKFMETTSAYGLYRQKTWLVPLISRDMVMNLGSPDAFYRNALNKLPSLNVKNSYLFVFENPIAYERENGWHTPERMYLTAAQHGRSITVYSQSELPVVTRENGFDSVMSEKERCSFRIFCLISGTMQYGVLAVQISPEDVDILYLISIQMANALMIYDTERKSRHVQQEREILLEELREKNEVLNFISEYDEMTRIYNRRGFMEAAMEKNRNNIGSSAVLLFADMDHLKEINDNYGHAAGDVAICSCADIMKEAAGEDGIVGRLGGDEFVAMLIGDRTCGQEAVERIHKLCARFNAVSGMDFRVEISVGCEEVVCVDSLSIADVLQKADKIMYNEKKMKRQSRVSEL